MKADSAVHRVSILWLGLLLCVAVAPPAAWAQSTRRELAGHVPKAAARLQPLHRLAATNQLRLAIGLPLRDPAALTNFLNQLYDPASANYHRYLSPAQFTAAFGPTEADYQKVIDFARSNRLAVLGTHSNRLVLEVRGTVADVERAFQVKMEVYQHPTEAREFYAPDVEPSVGTGVPILDVGGLNNYVLPRPRLRVRPATGDGNGAARVGSGPNGLGYMGADFRAAYAAGITNTGAGQSVGLLEFDSYYANDIYRYETNAHISTNLALVNVFLNGFNGVPSRDGNSEVALDIEMTMAMAPGLSNILVYAEGYPADANTGNIVLNRMATDNIARQLSCSWIIPLNATTDNILQEIAAQGQSFFDASGDDGGYVGDIPPPSDDPYMTQVGGTVLTTAGAGGAWQAEIVWSEGTNGGSSGGVSDAYSIPSWQQGVNFTGTMGSAYWRNFPDVAMAADNVFIVADNGKLETVKGTSCAAPLWAGFAALVNQQAALNGQPAIGLINSAIYRIGSQSTYAASFHDVTVGNNTNINCVSEFFAEPGYDLCTGWGSPSGSSLLNALLAPADSLQITPLATLYMSGPAGGPFNLSSNNFVLTNASAGPFNWTATATAAWLNISSGGGTLAAYGVSPTITVGLNGAANSLAAGIYKATVWFSNEVSHVGQARQFSLSVGQPVVANGGFENGDFSFWILEGDSGTNDFVDDGTYTGLTSHSGSYFGVMGSLSLPLSTLSQTVADFPGEFYTLSFWMENPDLGDGTSPNEFRVSWNGSPLLDQTNVPTISAWTNLQFQVLSSGTGDTLEFAAYNTNGVFALDDVSLTPHPAFFNGEAALNNGVYYLVFPNGNLFGYYTYAFFPYLYHFDLGFEYYIDANDGHDGAYLYDFTSRHWWYTSPQYPFPYLYDFNLDAVLYYYPDAKNAGHYSTNPRSFYNFGTGQNITL